MIIHQALAQIRNPVITNGLAQTQDPEAWIGNALRAAISLLYIAGIIYFLWHLFFAGFHYISSDGDSKKVEEAKNEILYTFIGLGVMFIIFPALRLLGTIFGIPGLENILITLPSL